LTCNEASPFFLFLFLPCLSKELHIMLEEDVHLDLVASAIKADKLWAAHDHLHHGTVASSQFEPPPSPIASICAIVFPGVETPATSVA
jgi:hypothetical protein